MLKLKPVLPSLREKKRYLAFEVISNAKVKDYDSVEQKITESALGLLGELGMSKAGLVFLKDKYNSTLQRGLIRVSNKEVNNLRIALTLVEKIEGQDVIIRTIGVSGILKKALNRYLAS